MADETGDAAPLPPDQNTDQAGDGGSRWWRAPLVATLVAVPVLVGLAGVRLGCDAGTVDLPVCGDTVAAADAGEVEISAGETAIIVSDERGAPVVVAREPAASVASQFTKFVVVAPDGARVLYVTAATLGLEDAALWVVPRGQPKQLLKATGDDLWVARPVWCQARPGDPGRIAYVMRGPVGGDLTGLELWLIRADGADDRRVLVGTTQNGFGPDLFYGNRQTPLRFLTGCGRLRYTSEDNHLVRVVDLDTGEVREPLALPGAPGPPSPAVPASPGAPAIAGQPCLVRPFAQTDPRWANNVMRSHNSLIRSFGCAMTSTAMVFNYYGVDTDPGRLNQCAGEFADELHWDPVRQRCAADKLPAASRWTDRFSYAELEASLRAGRPAIVGLQGGPAGSHFVVVAAGAGDQAANYKIVDSFDGSTYKTLADYVNPRKGYILRWLIIFDGTPPPCTPVAAEPTGSAGVTFLSPQDGGVYNTPQLVRYRVDAGPDARVEASHRDGATVIDEGPHLVTVTVSRGGEVSRKRLNFLIDRTPPEVKATWQRLDAASGRLALTATDALTAVTEAFYQVDDGPRQLVGATNAESVGLSLRPITLAGLTPGRHRVRYSAVDSAGNESPAAELAIMVGAPAQALLLDGAPLPADNALVELAAAGGERTLTFNNGGATPLEVTLDRARLADWVRLDSPASVTVAPGGQFTLRLSLVRERLPAGSPISRFTLRSAELGSAELPLLLPVTVAVGRGPSLPPGTPTTRPISTPGATPGLATQPASPAASGTVSTTVTTGGPPGTPTLTVENPRPSITRLMGRGFVTPVDGAARGLVRPFGNRGFTLTIQGERFVETAGIRLNGRPLRTRFISPTGLEAQVEDDDVDRLGAYAVTVVNPSPGGGESNRLSFTVVENARPTIDRLEGDDLTPASAGSPVGLSVGYRHPAGKPFTLIVRGSGFVETSAVFWAGQRLRTRFGGDDRLEATLDDEQVGQGGTFLVSVTTPGPGGGDSATVPITLLENPRPVLRQLEAKDALPPGVVPRIALPGAGLGLVWPVGNRGFTLTARGAGFVEDSVVRWGGKRLATTFVSATELRAEVENDEVERLGAVAVTVVSPSPGGGESVALAVVVVENPRPVLGRLDGDGVVALPTLAPPPLYRRPAGSGGFTLILIGSSLVRDTTARWNGRALPTKFISATQVEAKVEEEDAERVGPATVTLTSPQPGGGASNALTLTIVVNPQPAITRLEGSGFVPPPAGAPPGTLARPAANRGFTLTVRGRGFIEDSVVQWGERRLRPKLIDDETLEVRIEDDDAEQVGSYAVTVVNPKPGGGASNVITVLVTENPRPTITSLSVTTTRAGSGDLTITVRGRDFTERSSTRWNGQGRRTTYVSAVELRVVIPAADLARAGAFSLTVANPGPGGGVSNTLTFTVS